MADLKASFDKAVADSKNLPEKPDTATLLQLYALYKQASSGDVDGKRPGFTDMVGRAKWDAWNEIKGKDPKVGDAGVRGPHRVDEVGAAPQSPGVALRRRRRDPASPHFLRAVFFAAGLAFSASS